MSPMRRLMTFSSTCLCLLGLGSAAAGCADDGEKADTSTTTEELDAEAGDEGDDSTETTAAEPDPSETTETTVPTTVTDEEFAAALQPVVDQLGAAQEPCDVVDAVSQLSEMPDPNGTEQNRQAVEFLVLVANKAADTSTDPAQAEVLRSSGQALTDYAESVDYAAEKLDFSGQGPDIPEWDDFNVAMNAWYDTHAQECVAISPGGATDGTPGA
jgi:hypothetical protein